MADLPKLMPPNERRVTPDGPPFVTGRSRAKILAVCTLDIMAWVLLLPWLKGLSDAGYEVHIACSRGQYFDRLAAYGFVMHAVSLQRRFAPWVHLRPLVQLWRLIRSFKFDAVNTHSPVAAAVGRLAANLAGASTVIYTVHGFYFHDNMGPIPKRICMAIEWLAGRRTDGFMFVSGEDHSTALRSGIAREGTRCITLLNGVDICRYSPPTPDEKAALRVELGVASGMPVIGIVGRIVREKGHREFLGMAQRVAAAYDVQFLVVGGTLPSDRDQYDMKFRCAVRDAGLESRFLFTGITDRVADYLRVMDIFTLPSYREGFPRSVIEAMGVGLPVIVSDIRGCREAVVQGATGLIVPPRDEVALSEAVAYLLERPRLAQRMGQEGRARAVALYDERLVQRRFVTFIDESIRGRGSRGNVQNCAAVI